MCVYFYFLFIFFIFFIFLSFLFSFYLLYFIFIFFILFFIFFIFFIFYNFIDNLIQQIYNYNTNTIQIQYKYIIQNLTILLYMNKFIRIRNRSHYRIHRPLIRGQPGSRLSSSILHPIYLSHRAPYCRLHRCSLT